MAILNSFYFDGISSRERGLVIESKSVLNGPEPRLQEWDVPGRDGTAYLFEGYQNVEVSYTTGDPPSVTKSRVMVLAPASPWTAYSRKGGLVFLS